MMRFAIGVVLWFCTLFSSQAYAREVSRPALSAMCQVHVIEAQKKAGEFPKSLLPFRSHLSTRPFSAFRSFLLLRVVSVHIAQGTISEKELVAPYRLGMELKEQLLTADGKKRLRFILSLQRQRSAGVAAKQLVKTQLVLDRGGNFFLAGPRYGLGILVLGITCR